MKPAALAPSSRRDALSRLGIKNLVFAIQEPSLPGDPDEDLGRGNLASRGAASLYAFLAERAFNGLQLGPMGITSRGNPSPYDASLFSRSPLGLWLPGLAEAGLLSQQALAEKVSARPANATERVPYDFVHDAYEQLLAQAFEQAEASPEARAALDTFLAQNREWLVRDALWEPMVRRHGGHEHEAWEDQVDRELWHLRAEPNAAAYRRRVLEALHATEIRRHAFAQRLVRSQHQEARARCAALGLKLYGDLQIGISNSDRWGYAGHFLHGYRMGAPPSRTNPLGQPWNYAVLDPSLYGSREAPGPVLRFVGARMRQMLADFDSVRIDHPHGWVCPWVYCSGCSDPLTDVQGGARLFESPNLADHRQLAQFSRVDEGQLDLTQARHADGWVRSLTDAQVDAYALLVDEIVAAAKENEREVSDLICEVLSTLPRPLEAVMKRHGLGRFRVLQKASLVNREDVYRSENAKAEDWVMIGNHDTPSIWALIPRWQEEGSLEKRAADLAERLIPESAERPPFVAHLVERPGRIAHALFADALASPAQNVMLFFSDLFGIQEAYNAPGTVHPDNWTLRLTPDRVSAYAALAAEDRAIDLDRAISWALRARGSPSVR